MPVRNSNDLACRLQAGMEPSCKPTAQPPIERQSWKEPPIQKGGLDNKTTWRPVGLKRLKTLQSHPPRRNHIDKFDVARPFSSAKFLMDLTAPGEGESKVLHKISSGRPQHDPESTLLEHVWAVPIVKEGGPARSSLPTATTPPTARTNSHCWC